MQALRLWLPEPHVQLLTARAVHVRHRHSKTVFVEGRGTAGGALMQQPRRVELMVQSTVTYARSLAAGDTLASSFRQSCISCMIAKGSGHCLHVLVRAGPLG